MRLTAGYARVVRAAFARSAPEGWDREIAERIGPLVDQCEAKKAYELGFAVVAGAERTEEVPENLRKQLAMLKARVALRIR